jgi:hypothetical protein
MSKPKPNFTIDPLLAEIVAKLPSPDSTWPAESRSAWLRMMAMAFDVAYGPVGESAIPRESMIARGPDVMIGAPILQRYIIDRSGFARDPHGDRIMPRDVIGRLYDERGEDGDLGAIIWADESRGVLGLTLDISPAD